MRPSHVLMGIGLVFSLLWVLSASADRSSVVAMIGRMSWFLAVGALLGAAARLWWEGRP